jgi:hypothetical protein
VRPAFAALLVLCACHPSPDTSRWRPTESRAPWPDEAGGAIPIPAALSSLGWLGNPSRYGHVGPPTDRAHSGSFGLGNGRVFALCGLDEPRNTLTGAIGPGYEADTGFFGDSNVLLLQNGVVVHPTMERAQRPRGTAIARTRAESGPLAWSTTDVAPPGHDFIVRHLTVSSSVAGMTGLTLRITLARSANESPPPVTNGIAQQRGSKQLLIECPGATTSPSSTGLDITVPGLDSGGEWSVTCFYRFSIGAPVDDPVTDPVALLQASHDETAAFLAGAATLSVPDPKVADLYEGMLITEHVQTASIGVVSPMSRYTKGWLRDEEGPIRLYLSAGLFESARAILDGTYEALATNNEIANSFSLDTNISSFTEPPDPAAFWADVSMMPGYQPAESPSYAPLLHSLYIEASGDRSILSDARLAFLSACLSRQVASADQLLPFSGDEDYRYPMALVLGALPETLGWSAGSSFLFAAAADRLVPLGGDPSLTARATAIRAAVEAHAWTGRFYSPVIQTGSLQPIDVPSEDVSTQPLWVGFESPGDSRASANVDGYLNVLWRPDGTIASPTATFYTGMVPAYLLQNLTALNRDEAEQAFNALDLVASPSGHFEELHTLDNLAAAVAHAPDGSGGDVPARYRPWEGGDVVAAMLGYLLGATPDATADTLVIAPHLPDGWPMVKAAGLRMGSDRYDVTVEGFAQGQIVTVARTAGTGSWRMTVSLHGTGAFGGIWVNSDWSSASGANTSAPARTVSPGGTLTVVGAYAH